MAGGGREGMVVVVPGLAHRRYGEPEDVARLVVGREAAAAEEVTDRVDAPRHVVEQEDPHQPAPQEPGETARDLAGQQPAERERDRQPGAHERHEQGADHAQAAVLEQVGRVAARLGAASNRNSQPTWACHSPFSAASTPSPWPCGEWGSPSSSEYAWCLRWSATHVIAGPSTPIVPSTANSQRIGR